MLKIMQFLIIKAMVNKENEMPPLILYEEDNEKIKEYNQTVMIKNIMENISKDGIKNV